MTAAPMPGAGGPGVIGMPDLDGLRDKMFPDGMPNIGDIFKKDKADKRA